MRRFAIYPLGLGLTMIFVFLGSLAVQAADRDKLRAFLEVTGFDVALESIKLSARHAPEMLGLEASIFGSNWARLSEQVFDTDQMKGMALDMLAPTLSDELLDHAAAFYASDLGQRLVAVENASHMAEDYSLKRAEGEALVAGYGVGPGSRLEILQQLNEAVDVSGQGVRAIHELQIRFIMAASNAGVLGYDVDEGALRAVMREDEDSLKKSLRESGLYNAAYTYQDFTDDEMRAYRDALGDPKMRQVYELMNAIQHEVTANRFEALAEKLAILTGGEDL